MAVIEDDALYDVLTGLPGPLLQRAHLVHALKRAVRAGTRVAVLSLDVDDFTDLNERLGRELGDQVLVVVAARLRACLRGTDLTARLDGDDFAIVCEDLADPRDLAVITRRVADALAAPVHIAGTTVELRVSMGTALSAGGDQPTDLLAAADAARYEHRRRAARHPKTI
jgi:diguanylate cyclase (GGDEF)-like protein